ncbi:MAG: RidA family protein [Actinomycetota bacterium]
MSRDEDPIRIVPPGWNPEVSEQFGYSFGVKRGATLWVAGQVAIDDAGRPVDVDDVSAQTKRVLERIRAIVETAGGTMTDVVKTTTYITDRAHRPITNELRRRYWPGPHYPTNTLLVVAGLALPEFLVEIEAVAVIGR